MPPRKVRHLSGKSLPVAPLSPASIDVFFNKLFCAVRIFHLHMMEKDFSILIFGFVPNCRNFPSLEGILIIIFFT
jgi:hypothetical protein